MLTELVADQVAPAYWVPNKDVEVRIDRLGKKIKTYAFCLFIRAVLPASCYSVRIFPNIIVEVVRKMFLIHFNFPLSLASRMWSRFL